MKGVIEDPGGSRQGPRDTTRSGERTRKKITSKLCQEGHCRRGKKTTSVKGTIGLTALRTRKTRRRKSVGIAKNVGSFRNIPDIGSDGERDEKQITAPGKFCGETGRR